MQQLLWESQRIFSGFPRGDPFLFLLLKSHDC